MADFQNESHAALLHSATEHHRAGRHSQARSAYAELLAGDPRQPLALFRLGILELQEGQTQSALELMERASAAAPSDARIRFGRGQALSALHRWPEAAAAYRLALSLQPQWGDAELALGVALQRSGRPAEAVSVYRSLLEHDAELPGALGNLGAALLDAGDVQAALAVLSQAAAREPHVAAHVVNLSVALCRAGEFAAAEVQVQAALLLDPASADAQFNRGNALRGLGRIREAADAYRQAIALQTDHLDAFVNLGNALRNLGDVAGARDAFESAMRIDPRSVTAINNMGCLLRTLKRLDAAEDMFREGLRIDPVHPALLDNLGNVLKDLGELDEAIGCYRRSLEIAPDVASVHSNLAYSLSFQSGDPEPILAECLHWSERFAEPIARIAPDVERDCTPGRPLRIGYVSGDFREHCQTLFTLPLFKHHDRNAVELYCYSSVERPDRQTEALRALSSAWFDARGLTDAALARRVAADRIDILVDLNMHMANGRPRLFAHKPAPLQIAWLAYPGTTGMSAIDYRLSDPWLDPPGFDAHYREPTLRLKDTFWCYDALAEASPLPPLPATFNGHITLGCLNNPCKLTNRTFELWGDVLRALPTSRFVVLAPEGRQRVRLLRRFQAEGVAGERLRFVDFLPRLSYLRTYHEIDFCLDTFPYNGHTTTLDALWMGVPVVTRVGATCVGRGGLSMLRNLGLGDLAADSDEAFRQTAIDLASDLARMSRLRSQLRLRMHASPLMDAERFARNIEDAYRHAWRTLVEAGQRAPPQE